MKKNAFISIVLALTLLLSSCTIKIKGKGDNISSDDEETSVTEIRLNTDYSLTDGISFKLVKAGETPLILDTAGSGHGYEPYPYGSSYIDLIFDITNSSSYDFNCQESMNIEVKYDKGISLPSYGDESEDEDKSLTLDGTFVGENGGWASVSTFSKANVPAGETVRVHYFVASDSNILPLSNYNYLISYNDGAVESDGAASNSSNPLYKFTYKKSMGTLCDTSEIKLQETFTIENYANITLEEVKFSTKLTPSNTRGSYSYYEVREYKKTFLIFKFSLENLTEDVILSSSSIHGLIDNSANISSGDSYYVSGTILEKSNNKDLTQNGVIEAGKKNIVYVAFEVSTDFEESNNYDVTFMAGGNFYTYKSENHGADTSSDISSETSSY
ncbi:MAG: hypothetical protein PUB37_10540 [Firmicutes bacterium]|nr:hypothetical protein [Bacillota bacterium]